MKPTNTLLRHRPPQSPVRKPTHTSPLQSSVNDKSNKATKVKRHRSSVQSIFWSGVAIFTIIVGILIYYTTYYLPSKQQLISNKIDDNETVPFGFQNYPFDTPYELRNINEYSVIIAIGDLHGDLTQTLKILQLTNILNEKNEWIAKDTILIQTGDIVDRGKDSIEIYKLFFELRKEAQSHHCLVLQLLGNHEIMNIGGDVRYVHANELYKYGTVSQWNDIWSLKHKIGYFLRKTPIIRIIGHTLFVHAGLRPEILQIVNNENVTHKITKLNEFVLKGHTLNEFTLDNSAYRNEYLDYLTVTGTNGPLWTRDFEPRFYNMNRYNSILKKTSVNANAEVREDKLAVIEDYVCDQLNKTLSILNVKRMVIGHNMQSARVPVMRCEGKLFSIDVGISCAYGCALGAIAIDIQSDIVSIVTPL